jgi:hypothetical protein
MTLLLSPSLRACNHAWQSNPVVRERQDQCFAEQLIFHSAWADCDDTFYFHYISIAFLLFLLYFYCIPTLQLSTLLLYNFRLYNLIPSYHPKLFISSKKSTPTCRFSVSDLNCIVLINICHKKQKYYNFLHMRLFAILF